MTSTTEDKRYNGWTNYETWGVALILDNDEGLYNHVRGLATESKDGAPEDSNVHDGIWTVKEAAQFALASLLKDYTYELCGLETMCDLLSPMAKQLLGGALSDVNWDEIASNILSEES